MGWVAPLAGGAASGLGSIFGGKAQADAAKYAADVQSQAANHAADVQAKSAADALAFQKLQAHQDFLNAQAASRGNYDQWAARQGRLSTLGQMVGSKPFVIPAYVPMQEADGASPAAPTTGVPQGYPNPNVTTMGRAFLRMPNGGRIPPGIQT